MRKLYLILFLSILFVFVTGCDPNDHKSNDNPKFSLNEKSFIHKLFRTTYLWYDHIAQDINLNTYSSPTQMIEALRYNPPDKWSFMMTNQEYTNYSKQKTKGFGIGFTRDYTIFIVLLNSPSYGRLKRGDRILKINDQNATSTLIINTSHNLNTPAKFLVNRNNKKIEITVTPQEYTRKSAYAKIIHNGAKTIGYLRYDSFTRVSNTEIEDAFTKFHKKKIDELVIDLRYNGGGLVDMASKLMNNITNAYPGDMQIYLDWNDKNKKFNSKYNFATETYRNNELRMRRVFFLTSSNTASASELVINGLKPYLGNENIIIVGQHTHGKGVGMRSMPYKQNKNLYFLINFIAKNKLNKSVDFNGIKPTCSVSDNITHELGDTQEDLLDTALYYIQNGSCPVTIARQLSSSGIKDNHAISYMPIKINSLIEMP